MIICGIDPGLTGALAIIDEQGNVLRVEDLPVHRIARGKQVKSELDVASLRQLLLAQTIDHVILEKVAARPGQGVTSMFRFGYTAGVIVGLVAGLQLPYSFVTPQVWQRHHGIGPSPEAARQRASQLYPTTANHLMRKRDAGRADALLIAAFGAKRLRSPSHEESSYENASPQQHELRTAILA